MKRENEIAGTITSASLGDVLAHPAINNRNFEYSALASIKKGFGIGVFPESKEVFHPFTAILVNANAIRCETAPKASKRLRVDSELVPEA